MLANLYPALLHRLETTQDAILDAMDRLEIWLDSFGHASASASASASAGAASGKKAPVASRPGRASSEASGASEVYDSSDESDDER